jgi:N-methylhydantoinase A/oxoprolinase/acetone carboxylase beta subunit
MYRIGIDIGGTFTDFAAVDDAGRVVIAKSASTPQDPSDGLLEGLTVLAGELGIDRATSSRRRSASSTARPRPPTRCSSARAPAWRS